MTSISAAHANEIQSAWKLIETKDYQQALVVLSNVLINEPDNTEAQFLFARTLGWSGQYDKALRTHDELIRKSPRNVDYYLSKANILSWQGKNSQAINLLRHAREISPDYQILWQTELKLLQRINTSQAAVDYQNLRTDYINAFPKEAKLLRKNDTTDQLKYPQHQISFYYIQDNYRSTQAANNSETWKEMSISYEIKKTKNEALYTRLNQVNRYQIIDNQASIGAYFSKNNSTINIELSHGGTPKLLPQWSVLTNLTTSHDNKFTSKLGIIKRKYADTKPLSLPVGIGKYIQRFLLEYTLYPSKIENETVLTHIFNLSYFFTDTNKISLTAGTGEEYEYVSNIKHIIYPSDTIVLKLTHQISKKLKFDVLLSHSRNVINRRENIRNGFGIGINYLF